MAPFSTCCFWFSIPSLPWRKWLWVRYPQILNYGLLKCILEVSWLMCGSLLRLDMTFLGSCKALILSNYVLDLACSLAYAGKDTIYYWFPSLAYIQAAFDCIRIWSICQHEWLPTLLVFVFGMADPAINLVSLLIYQCSIWVTLITWIVWKDLSISNKCHYYHFRPLCRLLGKFKYSTI